MSGPRSVLFTGYAPVHFLCFRPIFERLKADPDFDVHVSGGLRTFDEAGVTHYDEAGLYDRLGVDPAYVWPMEELPSRDVDVLFSAHTNLIQPRSVGTSVQIFHGISFRNRGLRPANMGCDAYFVVGPYMERRLVSTGLMQPDDPRIQRVGFVKTDALVDGSLDRVQTLRENGLAADRPVVLYAPTGANHNSLQSMGMEVVKRLKESGRFNVLVKLHDHPKDDVDWHGLLAPLEDAHTRVARSDDVIPLLHAADLLISDASSVSNEFAMLDRPMVFLDVPRLIKKMGKADFQTMDLETWGRRGGPVVVNPEDVVQIVDDELTHPERHRELRQAMKADLFYNPGEATDAAMRWLRSHLLTKVA